MNNRIILYHKQSTSARTRFLLFANGSVCAFEPIPALAQIRTGTSDSLILHPAAAVQDAEMRLGLPVGTLKAEVEFRASLEIPGDTIHVILAAIHTVDPPFDEAERIGARFIDLTQARGLPEVELLLLRKAYEVVLGG